MHKSKSVSQPTEHIEYLHLDSFVKGADVGWLPQMEASGYKFYDTNGTEKDCLQLLKDRGINTIRLRVFVNPSNHRIDGHCSKEETVVMALRAKNLGFRILIDIHYSDSWADPKKQNKPAAWINHSFSTLSTDVYDHTYDVLSLLKKSGINPEWVQIGNEIPNGILWPDGHSKKNFSQLAHFLKKGYIAAKQVFKSIQVIIHIDEGDDNSKSRWFFDNMQHYNVSYDIIGLSYYPYWLEKDYTETIGFLKFNVNDIARRYNKKVMVVEVGADCQQLENNSFHLIQDTMQVMRKVPKNKGLGVIYWEPEGERSWGGYPLHCWQKNGKPSSALDAFKY